MDACPFESQLSAYQDGELSPEKRQELERHLATCPPCAAHLDQLRRISAILSTAPVPRLSPAARQELYALSPQVGEAMYLRIAKWSTALAASIMLAASGWMLAQQRGTPANPTRTDTAADWTQVAMNPPQSSDPQADLRLPDWVETNLSTTSR